MTQPTRTSHNSSDPSPAQVPGAVVEVELAQGLGLLEAFTIGLGTMIGAGIFVLPGIIIPRVGPAAIVSFLLGGVVALFNAMSAAEVATGMPKSGGGYYFISRALGPLWGAIIGWGSWFGLVFASAFYAVGFAEYVASFAHMSPLALALGLTAILIVLNLTGSRIAGQAQNLIVAVLASVLLLFIIRGLIGVKPHLFSEPFAPAGWGAVFAGTATLFITYCGFGEIASMAEEIRNPGRNLPRALLGSVIAVTVLYCGIVLICVLLRPYQELTGPTLVADLAQDLMGTAGRAAILVGAVMATVSSANASIMSASRISFAMGRDRLISQWLNQVHPRFRVPHRAIIITGALTILTILVGRIELLAEAAGFLHLLLYGLTSVACIILRGARLQAYAPAYRVPLFPLIPLLGALGSLAVAFFMEPITLITGAALILFAVGHYWLWARKHSDLRGAWPYFLRYGVLEPWLHRVERWGAVPDAIPTAVVAVANPEREQGRLQVAAAIMGPTRGQVLAVNVFTVDAATPLTEQLLEQYYSVLEERERTLRSASEPIIQAGAHAHSHVLVSPSVLYGLLSAVESSRASLLLLGWPEAEEGRTPATDLIAALDRYLRAHILILRQRTPIPAGTILALIDDSIHGDLALLAAARLTNMWMAKLTVAGLAPENADAEAIARLEEALEDRVGDMARASIRVVPTPSVRQALLAQGLYADLVVLGSRAVDGNNLASTVGALDDIELCSLLLARAYEGRPVDLRM